MSGYFYNWRDPSNQTDDPRCKGVVRGRKAKVYLNGKEFDGHGVYFAKTGEDGRIEWYRRDADGGYVLTADRKDVERECVFGIVAVEFCEQPKQYSEPRG